MAGDTSSAAPSGDPLLLFNLLIIAWVCIMARGKLSRVGSIREPGGFQGTELRSSDLAASTLTG